MNFVDREQLTGFRSPTQREKEGITKYFKWKVSRIQRAMTFWDIVCCVFAASFLMNLMIKANEGGRLTKEDILNLVFLCIFVTIIFFIRQGRKMRQILLNKITNGEYMVMECRAYETLFGPQMKSIAEVKIFNEQGQYCSSKFVLDKLTVRKCKEDGNTKLLLLKCSGDFYELLSEYRMGVG